MKKFKFSKKFENKQGKIVEKKELIIKERNGLFRVLVCLVKMQIKESIKAQAGKPAKHTYAKFFH